MRRVVLVPAVCVLATTMMWVQAGELPPLDDDISGVSYGESDEYGEDEAGGDTELNDSEALRIARLAEATEVSAEEIRALREGGETIPEDDFEYGAPPPEPVATEGMGWGDVAKALGVHPSELGHRKGGRGKSAK
jgi:hypothetical protein